MDVTGIEKKSRVGTFKIFFGPGFGAKIRLSFGQTRDIHASVIPNFSLIFFNIKICCENVTFTTCVLTFEGNKYRNNFELIENDDPKVFI